MARRSGGSRQWYCGRRRERVYTGASSRCGLALLGLEVVEDVGAHGSEHDMGKVFGVWDIVSVLDTASQFTNPELARGVGVVGVRATVFDRADQDAVVQDEVESGRRECV
ncbi:hypothetical protein GCM10009765_22140 [Fodinicola feengrottensis]|uniref:Uncharacterized protein n=1 Tax=Fodinicola feengrottensis TaxID=435914 RepID=A0ABP4SN07_9ACTN